MCAALITCGQVLISLLGFPCFENPIAAYAMLGAQTLVQGIGAGVASAAAPAAISLVATGGAGLVAAIPKLASSIGHAIGPVAFTSVYDVLGDGIHFLPFAIAAVLSSTSVALYVYAHHMSEGSAEVRRAKRELERQRELLERIAGFEESMETVVEDLTEDIMSKCYNIADPEVQALVVNIYRDALPMATGTSYLEYGEEFHEEFKAGSRKSRITKRGKGAGAADPAADP
jgi:MFS family permease